MGEWYNGYCFAEEAETDMYNTDMVPLLPRPFDSEPGRAPGTHRQNIRIDYRKLRHLLVTAGV